MFALVSTSSKDEFELRRLTAMSEFASLPAALIDGPIWNPISEDEAVLIPSFSSSFFNPRLSVRFKIATPVLTNARLRPYNGTTSQTVASDTRSR